MHHPHDNPHDNLHHNLHDIPHPMPRHPGTRRRVLPALAALLAWAAFLPPAQAQGADNWPSRPLKLLVGAPAGGSADLLARVVADGMSRSLGQPVVVDNRPGGLGAIAIDAFLAAPRDGYTYVVSVNSLVTEIPYTVKPKYDPFKDLKPLLQIAGSGLVLVADPALPVRNMAELVAYVKSHPGKTSFASYSPGTASHVKGLQLNALAGLDMQHVGYRGSPPALQDVMGGQVQFMFDGLATSLPQIKAGKLRALAVTSAARSPVLPDVPTVAELGYGDLTQSAWIGIWSTPDTPAPVQARMRAETLKTLAQPAVRERFGSFGLDVPATGPSPEELAASLQKDYEATGRVLRSIGYRPE